MATVARESPTEPVKLDAPLALTIEGDDQLDARLMDRVLSSPHDYFRVINREFSEAVCRLVGDELSRGPLVGLHGDAHIEQLAAVGGTVGLVDFDDSARGPAALDLVRFGVSIQLAQEELQVPARGASRAVDSGRNEPAPGPSTALLAFLTSYERALDKGTKNHPQMPAVLQRMVERSGSAYGPRFADEVFDHVERVHRQDASEKQKELWSRYQGAVRAHRPDLPAQYFEIVAAGVPHGMGVGSARRGQRYLLRIEGETSAAEDDLILEAKQVADASLVSCVASEESDAARVITGMTRFAPYRDEFAVVIPRREAGPDASMHWWVQSWRSDYLDLRLGVEIKTVEELTQAARWAGWLLADGHLEGTDSPRERGKLRARLLSMLDTDRPAMLAAVQSLSHSCLLGQAQLRASQQPSSWRPPGGEARQASIPPDTSASRKACPSASSRDNQRQLSR